MGQIEFKLEAKPSHSKGWARYAASVDGRKLVQSTGNEWVSASHVGEEADGSMIELRTQVMLRVGKGRTAREEISNETHRLIVAGGQSCNIEHRPGSQGIRLKIIGARPAD